MKRPLHRIQLHYQTARKWNKEVNFDADPVTIPDSPVSSPVKGRVIELSHEKRTTLLKDIMEKRAATIDNSREKSFRETRLK